MAAGIFGYLGYDMVRLMEELPPPNPDPIGIPDAILMRPTHRGRVRRREGRDHGGDAGAARARRHRRRPPTTRAIERLDRDRRRARPPARQGSRAHARLARSTIADASEHHAGRIPAMVLRGQGIHRRRRHLPGRAVAALRGAVRAAAVLALSRAAAGQSVALSVLSRLRRLRGRRLEPGNPGAGARRQRHDPPDRRHAAARRDAARGQGAGRRAARRSEGARRAPDAARSRPQRCRPRRRDRHA